MRADHWFSQSWSHITGLYHGSLHQSNLKGYKVIGFLKASQYEGDITVCL